MSCGGVRSNSEGRPDWEGSSTTRSDTARTPFVTERMPVATHGLPRPTDIVGVSITPPCGQELWTGWGKRGLSLCTAVDRAVDEERTSVADHACYLPTPVCTACGQRKSGPGTASGGQPRGGTRGRRATAYSRADDREQHRGDRQPAAEEDVLAEPGLAPEHVLGPLQHERRPHHQQQRRQQPGDAHVVERAAPRRGRPARPERAQQPVDQRERRSHAAGPTPPRPDEPQRDAGQRRVVDQPQDGVAGEGEAGEQGEQVPRALAVQPAGTRARLTPAPGSPGSRPTWCSARPAPPG